MLPCLLPPALISALVLLLPTAAAAPFHFHALFRRAATAKTDLPASYRPDRNPERLPYDIGAVVGGYVVPALIWVLLLLTVGRTMRRKALQPPKKLELELQEKQSAFPSRNAGPASPPLTARSWLKKFKKSEPGPQSPPLQSPTSFDQKVLDAHKDAAQADMERLYAAVMDHDARKSAALSIQESEVNVDRRPQSAAAQDDSPISPIKAIYPPNFRSGSVTSLPPRASRTGPPLPASPRHSQYTLPASPRSVNSKRSVISAAPASGKNQRFNLKNLRIAGPGQKYPGANGEDDDARTPLSPRFQTDLPSPATQPTSPATPCDPAEMLDLVQPLPRPAPQRLGSAYAGSASSPANSSSNLPLRSFAEPLKSPGIQTTVLDRRVANLSLKTPTTAVPFTPYSPYMPFTPITPVTPRLVSKKDRKMMLKIEGKRCAPIKEDLVQSPKEIFGDAY